MKERKFITACSDRKDFVVDACEKLGLRYEYQYMPSWCKHHHTTVWADNQQQEEILNELCNCVVAHPKEKECRKAFREKYLKEVKVA